MSNQQDYFNEVYQTAVKLGANPTQAKLAASQASLETGYGKSVKGNNHFGIKAGSKYNGETVDFATHEVYGGKKTAITDKFRAYDGLAGSVKGYLEFMPKAFPSAWNAPDFETASANLNAGKKGGYATDPKYASKLNWISNKFGDDIAGQEAPQMSFNDAGLPTGLDTPIPNGYDTPTYKDAPEAQVSQLVFNDEGLPVGDGIPTPFDALFGDSNSNKPRGLAALNPRAGKLNFVRQNQSIDKDAPINQVVSGAGLELDRDLIINSGYRSPAYNKKVGGAKKSLHTQKKAMDISMEGMSTEERQSLVHNLAQRGAGGFGTYDKYPDMLHVDMRKRSSEFRPHFMHNSTSKFMGKAPSWFKELDRNDGTLLPTGKDIPKPSFRNESQTYAAPRGFVERGGNLPMAIDYNTNLYDASPSDYANYRSMDSVANAQMAARPAPAPQQQSYRSMDSVANQQMAARPVATPQQQSYRSMDSVANAQMAARPVAPAPIPAYTPKASDYANYMMGVPAPQSTIAGPIGQPVQGIPIPAPRPTKIDRFKQKAKTKLKQHFKPQTVAARVAGGLIGGPLGVMAGPKIAQFINQRGFNGKGLSMPRFGSKQPLNRFQSRGNNSSNRMQNAMTGPRGATNTASNGSQATSLGNGQYTYYSPKSGKTSVKGEINMNKSADLRSFFGN